MTSTSYKRITRDCVRRGGGGDSDAYFLVILRHEFLNLRGKGGGRTNLIPSKSADAYQSNGLIKSLSQFFLGYFTYNSYVPWILESNLHARLSFEEPFKKLYKLCIKKKRTQDWCGSRVFSRASYGCFCLLVDGGGSKPIKFFLSFSVISFIMIFKAVLQLIHECCMVAQLME